MEIIGNGPRTLVTESNATARVVPSSFKIIGAAGVGEGVGSGPPTGTHGENDEVLPFASVAVAVTTFP